MSWHKRRPLDDHMASQSVPVASPLGSIVVSTLKNRGGKIQKKGFRISRPVQSEKSSSGYFIQSSPFSNLVGSIWEILCGGFRTAKVTEFFRRFTHACRFVYRQVAEGGYRRVFSKSNRCPVPAPKASRSMEAGVRKCRFR